MAIPSRALNALTRAKSHLAVNQPREAIADLEKVLQKAPKSAEAWWVMGKAKDALGEHEAAEQCLRRAAALLPRSYDIWFSLGLSLALRERYEDAAAAYERALDVSKVIELNALHNLGSCFLKLGRHADGAGIFEALADMGRNNSDVQSLLGMCRQGLGTHELALAAYQRAMKLGGAGYELHLKAAECACALGLFEPALQYATVALEAVPGDEAALRQLELARHGVPPAGPAEAAPP